MPNSNLLKIGYRISHLQCFTAFQTVQVMKCILRENSYSEYASPTHNLSIASCCIACDTMVYSSLFCILDNFPHGNCLMFTPKIYKDYKIHGAHTRQIKFNRIEINTRYQFECYIGTPYLVCRYVWIRCINRHSNKKKTKETVIWKMENAKKCRRNSSQLEKNETIQSHKEYEFRPKTAFNPTIQSISTLKERKMRNFRLWFDA